MSKIITQADFLARARAHHGNRYDYSQAVYTAASNKLTIICPQHGAFEQRPDNHLNGPGCAKCSKLGAPSLTLEQFIERAQAAHDHSFDYSQVRYINNATKVIIICPTHGPFEQTPNNHFLGRGCKACVHAGLMLSQEEFIAAARAAHGDRYDYSLARYSGNKIKATIICPTHGPFEQVPNDHMQGLGCERCRCAARTMPAQEFVNRARATHGDKYDYSQVRYVNSYTKVTITCPTHGPFEQDGKSHLKGRGCLTCSRELEHFWSAEGWAARQRGRTATLYVIRLRGHGEEFYKAGITFDLARRFSTTIPYEIEPVALYESADAVAVWEAEAAIKKQLRAGRYYPNKEFAGWGECYVNVAPVLALLDNRGSITRAK